MSKKTPTINTMIKAIMENTTLTQEHLLQMEHDKFIELFEIVTEFVNLKQKIKATEIFVKMEKTLDK